MRRLLSILVLLALAPVVFSAPFQHLHGNADADHFMAAHAGRALAGHTHFASHGHCDRPGGKIVPAGGEDAVSLDWFKSGPRPVASLQLVLAETTIIPAPAPAACWIESPVHRSHDPPLVSALGPRSPPAALPSPVGA